MTPPTEIINGIVYEVYGLFKIPVFPTGKAKNFETHEEREMMEVETFEQKMNDYFERCMDDHFNY